MKSNNDLDKIYSAITSIECPEELDIPDTLLLDEYCYFPYADPYAIMPGYPDIRPKPHDYSQDYLTFNILSDGYLCFTCDDMEHTKTIQYSKNNGEWTNLTSYTNHEISTAITVDGLSGTFIYGGFDEDKTEFYWEHDGTKLYYSYSLVPVESFVHDENWDAEYEVLTSENDFIGTKINVVNGDIVSFKGDNATYTDFDEDVGDTYKNYFEVNCNFVVEGNIMSLIDSENFATATTLASSYTFYNIFRNFTGLISAENLVLPATTLANYCYSNMFSGCTGLTSAPSVLPATTLADYCYKNMFYGCRSLIKAPELPAIILTNNCYENMFYGCTSLASAPEVLPATTLASNCYKGMFYNCSGLTSVPSILPATTLTENCYENMFYGCRSLTQAPVLPATTLVSDCYRTIFSGCTNLNYIKAMFTTTPSTTYTRSWVYGVASNGTFVKNSAAQWNVSGVNGIPNNWTVETA